LLGLALAHHGQVVVEVCFLAVEDLVGGAVALSLHHRLLDLQHLRVVVDVLGVNESSTHVDVAFLSEKLFDLFQVVAFEGTKRLPRNLSVAHVFPLDQEEGLVRQTVELSHFLLELEGVCGSVPLLVHFVEVVALNVKGRTGVTFLRLIFLEQAGQQSLEIVLKKVWVC
jgi:hypothetical protein